MFLLENEKCFVEFEISVLKYIGNTKIHEVWE